MIWDYECTRSSNGNTWVHHPLANAPDNVISATDSTLLIVFVPAEKRAATPQRTLSHDKLHTIALVY